MLDDAAVPTTVAAHIVAPHDNKPLLPPPLPPPAQQQQQQQPPPPQLEALRRRLVTYPDIVLSGQPTLLSAARLMGRYKFYYLDGPGGRPLFQSATGMFLYREGDGPCVLTACNTQETCPSPTCPSPKCVWDINSCKATAGSWTVCKNAGTPYQHCTGDKMRVPDPTMTQLPPTDAQWYGWDGSKDVELPTVNARTSPRGPIVATAALNSQLHLPAELTDTDTTFILAKATTYAFNAQVDVANAVKITLQGGGMCSSILDMSKVTDGASWVVEAGSTLVLNDLTIAGGVSISVRCGLSLASPANPLPPTLTAPPQGSMAISGTITATNCAFSKMMADNADSPVYVTGGSATFTSCDFTGNAGVRERGRPLPAKLHPFI
jgi:hypothetical protein